MIGDSILAFGEWIKRIKIASLWIRMTTSKWSSRMIHLEKTHRTTQENLRSRMCLSRSHVHCVHVSDQRIVDTKSDCRLKG